MAQRNARRNASKHNEPASSSSSGQALPPAAPPTAPPASNGDTLEGRLRNIGNSPVATGIASGGKTLVEAIDTHAPMDILYKLGSTVLAIDGAAYVFSRCLEYVYSIDKPAVQIGSTAVASYIALAAITPVALTVWYNHVYPYLHDKFHHADPSGKSHLFTLPNLAAAIIAVYALSVFTPVVTKRFVSDYRTFSPHVADAAHDIEAGLIALGSTGADTIRSENDAANPYTPSDGIGLLAYVTAEPESPGKNAPEPTAAALAYVAPAQATSAATAAPAAPAARAAPTRAPPTRTPVRAAARSQPAPAATRAAPSAAQAATATPTQQYSAAAAAPATYTPAPSAVYSGAAPLSVTPLEPGKLQAGGAAPAEAQSRALAPRAAASAQDGLEGRISNSAFTFVKTQGTTDVYSHTVTKGEWLSKIADSFNKADAKDVYTNIGIGSMTLSSGAKIPNANNVNTGTVIYINASRK